MAKSWCKVSAALDSHPRIRRAGNLGRQVFEFALRRNAEIDKNGVIPAEHMEPGYLADVLMLSEADAVTGVSACVRTRLLSLDSGHYVICGWDDEWGKHPMTEAQRKRVSRAKSRKDSDVTICPDAIVTESDGPECHRSDQIREEEIRGEKRESGAPSAAPVPPTRKRSGGSIGPRPTVPGHQETIACFTEHFEAAYHTKPTWDGRRAKQVQNLLRAHGEAEVRRRIGILFSGGLAWPAGPYDFDTLVKNFDKLAQAAAPARGGYIPQKSALELQLEHVARLEDEESRARGEPS